MTGRLAALSRQAVRLAALLPTDDPARIARWLYRYGTAPRGPEEDRDFGPGDDPMAVLALLPGGAARRVLDVAYEATTHPGWIAFTRAAPGETLPGGAGKLYISPLPDALPGAFPVIAEVLARQDVRAFKVGRGVEGLLRPDKIVAYFDTRAHLDATAAALAAALAGCPAQGVPFTTEAGGDGLLSRGVDPPPGQAAASWRAWVTRRLAAALLAARPARGAAAAAAALRAMAASRVDPVTWSVDPRVFDATAAP